MKSNIRAQQSEILRLLFETREVLNTATLLF